MTAWDDGEKAAVTVVYKRRWEVQQRWRTWRDGDAIIDPLNAESEGRGRIEPCGPRSPDNISEKYGPPDSSYLFIFSKKLHSSHDT
jgi:hypothetical protein